MSPDQVESLDDDAWAVALARAMWLEERQIYRMNKAIALAFSDGKKR